MELTKVMLEGRKEDARRFFTAGVLNIESGFLCMDVDEEMQDIYGPQCWCGLTQTQVGSRKRYGWK